MTRTQVSYWVVRVPAEGERATENTFMWKTERVLRHAPLTRFLCVYLGELCDGLGVHRGHLHVALPRPYALQHSARAQDQLEPGKNRFTSDREPATSGPLQTLGLHVGLRVQR